MKSHLGPFFFHIIKKRSLVGGCLKTDPREVCEEAVDEASVIGVLTAG